MIHNLQRPWICADDLWDGTLAGAEDYPEVWDSDLSDGSKLYVEWGREGDPFDGLMQVRIPTNRLQPLLRLP